jgi:hypothetical protein
MRKSFKSARSPDSSDGAFGESERRELARRSSAGVDETLYWHHTPTSKTWSRSRTVLLRREVGQERLIVPAEGAH